MTSAFYSRQQYFVQRGFLEKIKFNLSIMLSKSYIVIMKFV